MFQKNEKYAFSPIDDLLYTIYGHLSNYFIYGIFWQLR